jgi:hypothetical protein
MLNIAKIKQALGIIAAPSFMAMMRGLIMTDQRPK